MRFDLNMRIFVICSIFIFAISFTNSAHAAISFQTDKEDYSTGDLIRITGSVDIASGAIPLANIVISGPHSPFVGLIPATVQSDGTFSDSILAKGANWSRTGSYTISVTYDGTTVKNNFNFSIIESEPQREPEPKQPEPRDTEPKQPEPKQPEPKREEPKPKPQEKPKQPKTAASKPKTHIPGFPELDKSPQYYINRYDNEEQYRVWFDSQFPGKSIKQIVGYESNHIPGFPELDKSPQYYINRYDNEEQYRVWFDSQFPGKSIEQIVGYESNHIPGFPELDKSPQYYINRYDNEVQYRVWFDSQFPSDSIYGVLGFPDPVRIPDWIKKNAEWWSMGQISDDDFISGIQFMIENHIIIIPNLPESAASSDGMVPSWVRNNANWWALDKISEKEFVSAIKFLIEKGIIIV